MPSEMTMQAMMRYIRSIIIPLWLSTTAFGEARAQDIVVTYLGNMGVMIDAGEQAFIIDGLHSFYDTLYMYPPPALADSILNRQGRFKNTRFLFVTHRHRDHFEPMLTLRFLEHPNARAFVPQQASDSMALYKNFSSVRKRVTALKPAGRDTLPDLPYPVIALNIPHSSPQRHHAIQNIGYIIDIGGRKILHVGDMNADGDVLKSLNLLQDKIDVAILPLWMMVDTTNRHLIEQWIKPRSVIITHVYPGEKESELIEFAQSIPGSVIFYKLYQTARF